MNGSDKAYSAPRLESLSLRSTREIDISIGGPGGAHLDVQLGLGSLVS